MAVVNAAVLHGFKAFMLCAARCSSANRGEQSATDGAHQISKLFNGAGIVCPVFKLRR